MTHALSIDTLFTLLASLALLTSTTAWIAVCVAVERAFFHDAAMADASAECDAECDAIYARTLIAALLAADFPASVPASVRAPILRIVKVGAPASAPAASIDASDSAPASADRVSGFYPAAHTRSARRPLAGAGYRSRPPALDFADGPAFVFLAGYSVRTPRGRTVPATLALSQRGKRERTSHMWRPERLRAA